VVIITGTRFAYPLIQKWIDDYNAVKPEAQVIIEARGSNDPLAYDILLEAYDQDEEVKKNREYIHVARYAILPVANSKSDFAKVYSDKGLNKDLINQLFFHDIYADKEKEQKIKVPYTIYTRLQKAGAPIVFTKYFGYEQKDIKGKAIAGSDEQLFKTILRDTTGVTYLPLTLIYDHKTGKPVDGLTVLPVDFNGNGKVNDEEKFYGNLSTVIEKLENEDSKEIKNIPVEYIHLSVDKNRINPAAIEFLKWVVQNGQSDLHNFGYLKPEVNRFEKEKFEEFASRKIK
jgi:phosphate transport system substrate-binding protein